MNRVTDSKPSGPAVPIIGEILSARLRLAFPKIYLGTRIDLSRFMVSRALLFM